MSDSITFQPFSIISLNISSCAHYVGATTMNFTKVKRFEMKFIWNADGFKSAVICCWSFGLTWSCAGSAIKFNCHAIESSFFLCCFCLVTSIQKHQSCADCKYFWYIKSACSINRHTWTFARIETNFSWVFNEPLLFRLICSLFEWPQNAFVLPVHCCKTNAFGLEASCFVASEHLMAFILSGALLCIYANLTINWAFLSVDFHFIFEIKLFQKLLSMQHQMSKITFAWKTFALFHGDFFLCLLQNYSSRKISEWEIMLICFMPFQRICTTSKMFVYSTHFNFV